MDVSTLSLRVRPAHVLNKYTLCHAMTEYQNRNGLSGGIRGVIDEKRTSSHRTKLACKTLKSTLTPQF